MALLKADFPRLFALGFAAGALLVFAGLHHGEARDLARSAAPYAQTASAQGGLGK